MNSVTIDNVQFRIVLKTRCHFFERLGEIIIVCIQPGYNIAMNPFFPFSYGRSLSIIST